MSQYLLLGNYVQHTSSSKPEYKSCATAPRSPSKLFLLKPQTVTMKPTKTNSSIGTDASGSLQNFQSMSLPAVSKFRQEQDVVCYICQAFVQDILLTQHLFFGPIECKKCSLTLEKCHEFVFEMNTFECSHKFEFTKDPFEFILSMVLNESSLVLSQVFQIIGWYIRKLGKIADKEPWKTAMQKIRMLLLSLKNSEIGHNSGENNTKSNGSIKYDGSAPKFTKRKPEQRSTWKMLKQAKLLKDNPSKMIGLSILDQVTEYVSVVDVPSEVSLPKQNYQKINIPIPDNDNRTPKTIPPENRKRSKLNRHEISVKEGQLDLKGTKSITGGGVSRIIPSEPMQNAPGATKTRTLDPAGDNLTKATSLVNSDRPPSSDTVESNPSKQSTRTRKHSPLIIGQSSRRKLVDHSAYGNYLVMAKAVEECPMCYTIICPSKFTVNVETFVVTYLCECCELTLYFKVPSDMSVIHVSEVVKQKKRKKFLDPSPSHIWTKKIKSVKPKDFFAK